MIDATGACLGGFRADDFLFKIADGGDLFVAARALEPGVADDAADGGHGTGRDYAMADGGDGGDVFISSVRKVGTLAEHAVEAGGVAGAEAGEIVGAELVHDDDDDEFGFVLDLGD